MGEERLKPCPFCDDKAVIISISVYRKDGKPLYHVCCNGSRGCTIMQGTWTLDKKNAVEAWNKRAPEATQRECDRRNNEAKGVARE